MPMDCNSSSCRLERLKENVLICIIGNVGSSVSAAPFWKQRIQSKRLLPTCWPYIFDILNNRTSKHHQTLCNQFRALPSDSQVSVVSVQIENGLVCFNIRINASEEVLESSGWSVILRHEISAESQQVGTGAAHSRGFQWLLTFHQEETGSDQSAELTEESRRFWTRKFSMW